MWTEDLMIIPITDSIRIAGRKRCWELQKRRTRTGRNTWQPYRYYSSLGQALAAIGEQEIRLSKGNNLADAVRAYTDVCQRYDSILDSVLSSISDRADPAAPTQS